jgi:1-acyl-sn-glycerol-3-phosphate acyltransferase
VSRWRSPIVVDAPGRPTPSFVRLTRSILHPMVRLFHRATLAGTEHLPEGPYLLVANHSGGLAVAEISSFVALYVDQVGAERPLTGFAHPLAFHVPPVSTILRHLGAVPSTYEAARAALDAGVPLLVFPGGDHEALRPIWQAARVDFGGRKGFLKIARERGVPIVPMGIRGSHFTAPVLWRSRLVLPHLLLLPRLVGLKRWALTLLGLAGAIAILTLLPLGLPWRAFAAWLWLSSPLVFLPFVPWTIRLRIGRPLPARELFGDDDPTLERALARVEGEVQRLVSE